MKIVETKQVRMIIVEAEPGGAQYRIMAMSKNGSEPEITFECPSLVSGIGWQHMGLDHPRREALVEFLKVHFASQQGELSQGELQSLYHLLGELASEYRHIVNDAKTSTTVRGAASRKIATINRIQGRLNEAKAAAGRARDQEEASGKPN